MTQNGKQKQQKPTKQQKENNMKTKIYASYNKLTCELHNQTFMAPNDEVAKNIIENSLFDKDGKPDANSIRNAKNYKLCFSCASEYHHFLFYLLIHILNL